MVASSPAGAIPSSSSADSHSSQKDACFSTNSNSSSAASSPAPALLARPSISTSIAQKPFPISVLSPATTADFSPHGLSLSPPASTGPMSTRISVPARPKPGRKAATDEPQSKRKAQNRQAQRNFRARKQEQAQTLEVTCANLRQDLEHCNEEIARLQAALEESGRAFAAVKGGLEGKQAELDGVLGQVAGLQQEVEKWRMLAVEADKARLVLHNDAVTSQEEIQKEKARADRAEAQLTQIANFVANKPTDVPTLKDTPQDPKPANGCGNCGENGSCACVDSYLDTALGNPVPSHLLRNQPPASMSIDSILSPHNSSRRNAQQPPSTDDLTPPHDDLETDFTQLFTKRPPAPAPAPQPAPVPVRRAPELSVDERCGFCTEGSSCPCAEEAALKKINPNPPRPPTHPPAPSSHATAPGPGSCDLCQRDPVRRAWCIDAASGHPRPHSPGLDGDAMPLPKRRRRNEAPTLPCVDAYPVYKKLESSAKSVGYDDVLREFLRSRPMLGRCLLRCIGRGMGAGWDRGRGRG
ncbi:hypothetical protein EJ06DRAFT_580260 [Trichodelitschia bisporula]|uniref:BZIP domain-containing protein n=1 Tax=Trichodelitschia bisporula TaxID=703511 RepID=A0A6G1I468_9PEZI|nr:hypothetical protein EJ06DRAFT_580260 [Trichodelitschia bisporula]